jgi:hypothetical protein
MGFQMFIQGVLVRAGQRIRAHLASVTLDAVLALGQEGQKGRSGELSSEGSSLRISDAQTAREKVTTYVSGRSVGPQDVFPSTFHSGLRQFLILTT